MKKIYKLTENDLTNLIRRVINEQTKYEFLKQVLGNSGDDIVKADAKIAAELDSVFANLSLGAKNIIQKNGKSFIVSARGTELSLETFQTMMKDVLSGRRSIDEISVHLPSKLMDGTDFRSLIVSNMKKLGNVKSPNLSAAIPSIQKNNTLRGCISAANCWKVGTQIESAFKMNFNNLPKNFDPKQIKVTEKGVVSGREVLNIDLPNGNSTLIYKSLGANTATTGKKAGEWFVIPGWAENGWFFKTESTISITKGGNQYMTELAKFLEKFGSQALR